VQARGRHDVNKAGQIIGTTAQLQFYDFENDLTGPSKDSSGNPVATGSLFQLLTDVKGQAKKGTPTAYYLFNAKKRPVQGPEDTVKKLLDTPRLKGKVPKGFTVL